MSTHSAECSPYNCREVETPKRAPSMNAMRSRTMIRKTSLLRKINPMMRRSSFTKKIIYNPHILQVLPCERRERRNDLEIMNWIPQITLQTQNSDQSPLYDVRNPASRHPGEDERMRSDVSRTTNTRTLKAGIDLQFHLVEPDGIEPTTSCLQSTRSPS